VFCTVILNREYGPFFLTEKAVNKVYVVTCWGFVIMPHLLEEKQDVALQHNTVEPHIYSKVTIFRNISSLIPNHY
jgi:hypothetical protein